MSVKRIPVAAFGLAAAMLAFAPAVAEQRTPNPLRPKAEESVRAKPEAEAPRPRRERSEAQKQNDEMMRACGQEWRAEKAALQAKGETWRGFLKECRAKKRAEIRA
jgi:hypothetical protein